MAVTRESQLLSRLRLSEYTMARAAKVLEEVAEIPAMRREIERRLEKAASLARDLRDTIDEQQRDYPDARLDGQ